MTLKQTFEKPISGFWDYGPKTTFEWSIDGYVKTDSKGNFVRVGSWEANCWFHVAAGKTEKQTLGNIRRKLSARAKRLGLACTFEYVNN